MSSVTEWNKAKQAASQAGIDTSAFDEVFSKHLHKMDEELLVFYEYKRKIVKHLQSISQMSSDYQDVCRELEKDTTDAEQCQALEDLIDLLAQIDRGCVADAQTISN